MFQDYNNFNYSLQNARSLLPKQTTILNTLAKNKFNWGNVLTNTQKTLGIINQTIPIVNQVKPIWTNARTMFKIMGALNEKNIENPTTNNTPIIVDNKKISTNSPTFYI